MAEKKTDKRTKADKEAQEQVVGGTSRENFKEQEGAGDTSSQLEDAAATNANTDPGLVSRESGFFTGTGVVANQGLDARLPGYADIPLGSPRAAQILAEERERGHELSDRHYEEVQEELAKNAEKEREASIKDTEKRLEKQRKEDQKRLDEAAKDREEGNVVQSAVDSTIALKVSSGAMSPDEVIERVETADDLDTAADAQEAGEEVDEAEKDEEEKAKEHEEATKKLKEATKEREAAQKQARENLDAGEAPGVNADQEEADKATEAQTTSAGTPRKRAAKTSKDDSDNASSAKAG